MTQGRHLRNPQEIDDCEIAAQTAEALELAELAKTLSQKAQRHGACTVFEANDLVRWAESEFQKPKKAIKILERLDLELRRDKYHCHDPVLNSDLEELISRCIDLKWQIRPPAEVNLEPISPGRARLSLLLSPAIGFVTGAIATFLILTFEVPILKAANIPAEQLGNVIRFFTSCIPK